MAHGLGHESKNHLEGIWRKVYQNVRLICREEITRFLAGVLDTGSGTISGGSLPWATPSLTLGASNAAGSTSSAIRSNATIRVFNDSITPADVAGAAVVGTAAFASRADHVHVGAATGQYRIFTYTLDGMGGFDFVVDLDGNPVTSLQDLE